VKVVKLAEKGGYSEVEPGKTADEAAKTGQKSRNNWRKGA